MTKCSSKMDGRIKILHTAIRNSPFSNNVFHNSQSSSSNTNLCLIITSNRRTFL